MVRGFGRGLAAAAMVLGLAGCAGMHERVHGDMAQADASSKTRIVLQVSDGDPKTWKQALNVVGNLRKAYTPDKIDIELVVFGNGIGMLELDSPEATRVGQVLKSGTQVMMCENTMAGFKKSKADMLPAIGYVPGGIVEILEKSRAGWTIVRP